MFVTMNMSNILLLIRIFLASMLILVDCQSSSSGYYLRIRRRCPTTFPTRSQLIHSKSIVLVGLVEHIKPMDDDPIEPNQQSSNYLADVLVRRVLHGQRSLQHTRIQVTGFNPPQARDRDISNAWCHPNTRQGDSWIFVLQPINYPEYFRVNSSLIKVTLTNLEKFDSIIADQPYGLRPNFPELPCEKKYCQNNANCINDPYSLEGARCECLTNCKTSKYEPVCGSDDETYNNECELRMRSCRANKNLFVKAMSSCYYFHPTGSPLSYVPTRYDSSQTDSRPIYNRNYYRQQQSSTTMDRSRLSPSSYSISNRPQYPLPPSAPGTDINRWHSSRVHHTTSTTINRSFAY